VGNCDYPSGIEFYEKKMGQLFCQNSSIEIIKFLKNKVENADKIYQTEINSIEKKEQFIVKTSKGYFTSDSVVIATGGISWPQIQVDNWAEKIAKIFETK
jgi:predicted flavoprotein YhiN